MSLGEGIAQRLFMSTGGEISFENILDQELSPTDHAGRFEAGVLLSILGHSCRYANTIFAESRKLIEQAMAIAARPEYEEELARQMLSSGDINEAFAASEIYTRLTESISNIRWSFQGLRASIATATSVSDLEAAEQLIGVILSLDTTQPPVEYYLALGDLCRARSAADCKPPSPTSPLAESTDPLVWYTKAASRLASEISSAEGLEQYRLADAACSLVDTVTALVPPPMTELFTKPPILGKMAGLLESATAVLGVIPRTVILRGKLASAMGDVKAVRSALSRSTVSEFLPPDSFVTLAEAELAMNLYTAADASMGSASGLIVSGDPRAIAVNAELMQARGRYADSIASLERKLAAVIKPDSGTRTLGPTVRRGGRTFTRDAVAGRGGVVDPQPHAALSMPTAVELRLFNLLMTAYLKAGRLTDAASLKEVLWTRYEGEQALDAVRVQEAERMLDSNDVEDAIALLKEVPSSSVVYPKAAIALADALLERRNDKRGFIDCYTGIHDAVGTAETAVLLGRAYGRIGMLQRALETFDGISDADTDVTVDVCRTLVATRRVDDARQVYHTALFGKNTELATDVRTAYVELLLHLQEYAAAAEQARVAISIHSADTDDTAAVLPVSSFAMLCADAILGASAPGCVGEAMAVLHQAFALLTMVLNNNVSDPADALAYKDQIASLCLKLHDLATRLGRQARGGEFMKAGEYLTQALQMAPRHIPSLLQQAEQYLAVGKYDEVAKNCDIVADQDPSNTQAVFLKAKASVERSASGTAQDDASSVESAVAAVRALVDRCGSSTDTWTLTMRLVTMLRRGKLDTDAAQFVAFDPAHPDAPVPPSFASGGFHACRGLYMQYTGRAELALRSFDRARVDPVWRGKALVGMAQVYLNPEGIPHYNVFAKNRTDEETRNVANAVQIIREARPLLTASELVCLETGVAIVRGDSKDQCEELLSRLNSLVANDTTMDISLKYHSALMNVHVNKDTRARTLLKELNKDSHIPPEQADAYVEAMLLYADLYLGLKSKPGEAKDLVEKYVLPRMPHHPRALEILGIVDERGAAYVNAIESYVKAWELSAKKNADVGFRLAFNYEKAGDGERCIAVLECLRALGHVNADTKRLRDKACSHIRR
ncbi:TPR repeat region circular [Carpediemonas membranifera]|uniref:TPR repeat region circular n=1 Tax=Carpediemonas membranifera TaxID=201153 RepID=A0A8J6E3L0_9EUKA|nr:TPR repeat region circular [Carpediemonas membranifera]|eukprot:KAG9395741.1 TPR repeat region circular [Carpediemonas membranifera]